MHYYQPQGYRRGSRLLEVKSVAQGHIASKWLSCYLIPKSCALGYSVQTLGSSLSVRQPGGSSRTQAVSSFSVHAETSVTLASH